MQNNDVEFEKRLTYSLYEAARLDYMNVPSDDELERIVQPSPRFQRRMGALLRNPVRYVKTQNRPVYLRTLRTVAAVFVVFMMLLASTMVVSPTVRAAVIDFVKSWFEDRTEYNTPSGPIGGNWSFNYIPEGFSLVVETKNEIQIFLVYENKASEQIFIEIGAGQEAVDNEHSVSHQTTVNGRLVDVYNAVSAEYNNILVIYDAPTGVIIIVSSHIAVDELIKIAENIGQ